MAQDEGGISSRATRAVILDSLNRPITAGGFVEGAEIVYEDRTVASGLSAFVNRSGGPEKRYIIETKSGGAGAFDFDNDGWIDVYLLTASPWEALFGKAEHGVSRLFRNRGDGTFEDVTEKAGVPNRSWAFGVVAGDYNGDGWVDLYVSNFGPNRLYRNNGDGTFTDVAATAGVVLADYMTTGASFGDYDKDGDLDLFVCGYAAFNPLKPPQGGVDVPINYCRFRGTEVMCGPRGLPGTRDFLFRNNGDGTFTEVAREAGVDDAPGYYGFTPIWVDINDDGWLDLAVANDSTPNYLYLNRRDGTFEDISFQSGFALSEDGRSQAGMGMAAGDYNRDGLLDLVVCNFSDDYNTLYRNMGDEFFVDVSFETGLAEDSLPFVSWGPAFLDFDNDGLDDLLISNGHTYPNVDQHAWGTSWKQRPLLFRNLDGKKFQQVPPAPNSGLAALGVGRGAAFADFDNDGRIDAVINCVDSSPIYLHNVLKNDNHWVTIGLVSGKGSPPQGIGAVVRIDAGGIRQRKDVVSGGSFASTSDLRIHAGLGKADRIDRLEIRWPSGRNQVLEGLPADRFLEIREMDPQVRDLPGTRRPTSAP